MSEQNCSHDCSSCGAECSSRTQESFAAPMNAKSRIKKVIAVVSGKGGVGKSLVTALMAVSSQRAGLKTAILDADITGPSVPKMLGLHGKAAGSEEGIYPAQSKTGIKAISINLLLENETDPVIWRGPVIAGVVKQFWSDVVWGDIDVMYVDMPPGTGDVPLTIFQSLPIDGILIVTSPQELVSMIVEKAAKMAEMMHVPVLGLVENMSYAVCPDCDKKIYIFGESGLASLADHLSISPTAQIPLNPKLAAACDKGMIELFEGDWLNPLVDHLIND